MPTAETQPESSRRMYNTRADKYDGSHHPKFALDFLGLVSLKPGEHVLDLACGTGLVTVPAAERVAPDGLVVGVDIADGMLARAQHRAEASQHGKLVTLVNHSIIDLGTVKELKGKQGTFDYVTCCSALVLLQDPISALKQWVGYLKPGSGRLVVDVTQPGAQPQGYILELAIKRIGLPVYYNREWATGEDALRKALGQAGGLEIEQCVFQRQLDFETREFPGTAEEAGRQFDSFTGSDIFAYLARDYGDKVQALRDEFIRLWMQEADHGDVLGVGGKGAVVERDGVWTAVARKT